MLRSLKIWLMILLVFTKRRLLSLWSTPFKLNGTKLAVLFGLILLVLAGLLYTKFRDQAFRPTITEGVIGTYKEKDLPDTVNNLLSRGLVKVDRAGVIQPDLAKSIESTSEGTLYTVKLQDNLTWADKTPLKASDLGFNFGGVQVSFLDDKTIQFKLSEPFSPFPSLLARPIHKNNSNLGVGPYLIASVSEVAKEGYQVEKLHLRSNDKILPDIVFYLYPTESLAREALKLGEIQAILGLSDSGDLYPNQSVFKSYQQTNLIQLMAIFYNTKDPILSDDNFRLALSFAAPAIAGETEAHTSLPDRSWVYNSAVKDYLDNPTQAQIYLQKVKNGKDETITLTTTSNLAGVGEKVVKAWNSQGIKARLKVESGVPQIFQALLITQSIPLDPDQYSLWHSTQSQTNISKISNPRIDKDLEDGRRTADPEKRKQIYQDFQKTLLDHAPATFLYFPKTKVIYNQKIEGELMKVLSLQLGQ